MSDKKIGVGIRGTDESAQDFIKAWRRAEAGEAIEEPRERLYFEDLATLLQVLTPCRLELLRALHHAGSTSIRALSMLLQRDYKNVHQDVQVLMRVGLIIRGQDTKLTAPWDKVVAEIDLAA